MTQNNLVRVMSVKHYEKDVRHQHLASLAHDHKEFDCTKGIAGPFSIFDQ